MKKILISVATVAMMALTVQAANMSSSAMSKHVASQKASYKKSGFVLTSKGKGFTLRAEDERKVRAFLFDKFLSLMPESYAPTFEPLKQEVLSDKNASIKGLEFDMKVQNSKSGAKLMVTLRKLPDALEKKMNKKPKDSKWFHDMIRRGTFAYMLTMDKKGKINSIRIKDVSEKVKIDKASLGIKMQGIWAKFNGTMGGKFFIEEEIKNIAISVNEGANHLDLGMKNLKGKSKQKSPYDEVSSGSIERVYFNFEEHGKFIKFLMQGNAITSKTDDVRGFINSKMGLTTDKVQLRVTETGILKTDVILQGFKFGLKVGHLSKEAVETMQTLGMETDPLKAQAKSIRMIEKLLKAGFTFDITALNVKNFNLVGLMNIRIRDLSFTLNASLKKNKVTMQQGVLGYIPFVKVNARLALNSADLDKLATIQPMLGMLVAMKKMKGKLALFDIAFVNGQITINGQMLPF